MLTSGYWNDTPVAIKQLRADLLTMNPAVSAEFSEETKLLRQLRHPNIVTLLGAGSMPGGAIFLVRRMHGQFLT